MKRKLFVIWLLILIIEQSGSQIINQVQQLGFLDLTHRSPTPSFGNVSGFVRGGKEYAIIPSTDAGISIVDVSNPYRPVEVSFIPIPQGADRLYYAEYYSAGYIYATMRPGPLQIINVKDPYNAFEVKQYSQGFTEAYRPWVDEKNRRLYLVDLENNPNGYNLLILDISDPENPVEIGGYGSSYHHIYVRNDTLWGFAFSKGVDVLDVSNPQNILWLSNFDPGLPQTHSGWLHDNGKYLTVDHEYKPGEGPDSSGGYLQIFDVSSLSTQPPLIGIYSTSTNHTGEASLHHSYWYDQLIYMSYWTEGVRIVDATNIAAPVEVGVYDWEDPNVSGIYRGAWGVFPYLPSRNILVSRRQYGLYVLDFLGDGPGIYHNAPDTFIVTGNEYKGSFNHINGTAIDVAQSVVYWRTSTNDQWQQVSVYQETDSTFGFTIPVADNVNYLEYYIAVKDTTGRLTRAPGKAPFLDWYRVQLLHDTSLPVELVGFEASVNENHVFLTWETASEINNMGFAVYRKIVDVDTTFLEIAHYSRNPELMGAGNSHEPRFYQFVDRNVPSGNMYYLLKSFDYSGGMTEYGPINVQVNGQTASGIELLRCYPNPFNGRLTISLSPNDVKEAMLVIIDVSGRLVTRLNLKEKDYNRGGTFNWDAEAFPSGIYFVIFQGFDYQEIKKVVLIK